MTTGIARNFEYRQVDMPHAPAPEYPSWVKPGHEYGFDWCTGFDKCVDGEPLEACRNETERKGWMAANHSGPTQHMTAKQLEALGI